MGELLMYGKFVPLVEAPDDSGRGRYFHVVGSNIWEADEPAHGSWGLHFLGVLGDTPCWAVDVPHGEDPADGASTDLFSYFGRNPEIDWLVAGRAVQLIDWARSHRFCGRCGNETHQAPGERAMRCPSCKLLSFPRLAPAIITLVTRGDEALLAHGVTFRAPMYSTLAGFVEAGESLEDAVHREILEEVGVHIRNVRYWGSQPWPFPHSLMLGFHAEWASGDINIDPKEIVDAQWFHRDALPDIPPRISIARKLIDAWLAGEV